MSEENVPLRWNKKRHDEAVEKATALEGNKRGRQIVANKYQLWKNNLKKLAKRKKLTTQVMIAELYKLRDEVADAMKHTPGMEEWRVFTMNLIEDKISQVLKTDFGTRNVITEWLAPERRENADGLLMSETGEFGTYEEFTAIPFVRKYLVMDGFVGFYSSALFVNALFMDGEIAVVGTVQCGVGLEKLPTHKEIVEALSTSAQTPGEPWSTETGLPPDSSGPSEPGTAAAA